MKAKGGAIKGKELKTSNGKSYIKPQQSEKLQPKKPEELIKKGIAIVVDFPVETPGEISDVPGVNYPQIPYHYFNDLMNGDTYNPMPISENL
ncbi:hypothetical protein [Neobacillus niacini]|uniref:hypothetical protein n=1 Tax=Neobacillus niacini TaxID=86668 RepID=UPI0021CAF921|nr:hypothetical protein [Neobacillus niacini]MCM3765617.1 hypothetical protein [Neobacillus niacini]